MSQQTANFLLAQASLTQAMGADAINSDAILVIDGYENLYIRAKSFPDPVFAPQGTIEVPTPFGGTRHVPQQANPAFTGGASFIETESRIIEKTFNEILVTNGGYFNGYIYQGSPDSYVNRKRLRNCVFTMSAPPNRDTQSNTEVLLLEGDISGLYFNELEDGDINSLMGLGG